MKRGEIELLPDLLEHRVIIVGIRIQIAVQNPVGGIGRPLQLFDGAPGDELHLGIGAREIKIRASEYERGAGRADVDFPRAVLKEILRGFPKLGSAHDGVVDEKKTLSPDEGAVRNQLHLRDQVPLVLMGRHKRARPGRRVFDKGPGIGNAGGVRVADRVRDTRIRDAGDTVRPDAPLSVPLRELSAASVPGVLDVEPLIGGRGEAVVDPEKCADPHILPRRDTGLTALGREEHHLARPELLLKLITQIQKRETLEADTVAAVLFADLHRSASPAVSGGVNSLFRENQDGHGTADQILRIADALREGGLLGNNGSHDLRRVDASAAHFLKMLKTVGGQRLCDFVHVVDSAHRRDGKDPEMRAYDERLGLIIGNAADAQMALHLPDIPLELRAEIGTLDVVNRAVKPLHAFVDGHACAPCSEV